ncbi:uncharacterized protein TRIADDRAFT_59604 [Trichoplax adhaerens]|uniref:Fibronectin type-III domain-containing protein n=1 Tax=Trichoplax adhaerens TaxID=10228 RepID=B3S5G2_TRIAD|nr:predicted protein [Trichoplax adhaerens]EDV21907.1 predicted protein [Trichoplax adhaerens]|eukprot:XP_002115544.1 predicted protein [Trichoplax adhaerens]
MAKLYLILLICSIFNGTNQVKSGNEPDEECNGLASIPTVSSPNLTQECRVIKLSWKPPTIKPSCWSQLHYTVAYRTYVGNPKETKRFKNACNNSTEPFCKLPPLVVIPPDECESNYGKGNNRILVICKEHIKCDSGQTYRYNFYWGKNYSKDEPDTSSTNYLRMELSELEPDTLYYWYVEAVVPARSLVSKPTPKLYFRTLPLILTTHTETIATTPSTTATIATTPTIVVSTATQPVTTSTTLPTALPTTAITVFKKLEPTITDIKIILSANRVNITWKVVGPSKKCQKQIRYQLVYWCNQTRSWNTACNNSIIAACQINLEDGISESLTFKIVLKDEAQTVIKESDSFIHLIDLGKGNVATTGRNEITDTPIEITPSSLTKRTSQLKAETRGPTTKDIIISDSPGNSKESAALSVLILLSIIIALIAAPLIIVSVIILIIFYKRYVTRVSNPKSQSDEHYYSSVENVQKPDSNITVQEECTLTEESEYSGQLFANSVIV